MVKQAMIRSPRTPSRADAFPAVGEERLEIRADSGVLISTPALAPGCDKFTSFVKAVPNDGVRAYVKGLAGNEVANASPIGVFDHDRCLAVERLIEVDPNLQIPLGDRFLVACQVERRPG